MSRIRQNCLFYLKSQQKMAGLYLQPEQAAHAYEYFASKGIPAEEGMRNLEAILGKKILVKIGGDCLNNGGYDSIAQSLAELYSLDVVPTILHGGGAQIDKIMEEREIPIIKVNGLRVVPDESTLDAVIEALSKVNGNLVNAINKYAGSDIAVGLMNEKIIYAEKMQPVIVNETGKLVDFGYLGDVTKVDNAELDSCIKKGKIPVLWCIGYGNEGQQFNINADVVGGALAHSHVKYILLTTTGGYRENGEIVPEMNLEEAKKHNADGGMGVKLNSIVELLENPKNTNLDSVQIASPDNLLYELLTDKGRGTIITK